MKSTITQLSPVNTKKEEVIRSLHADRQTCESHLKKLQELFKTDSPQQIGQKLHNIIVRENVFNAIMNEVARSFEVTFDQAEVDAITKQLTPQFQYKPEYIQEIAKKVITKSLIFQSLAKE
jgi:FKBP-type peptidyl-prolyl cis-trans isomerase (trigger factor)